MKKIFFLAIAILSVATLSANRNNNQNRNDNATHQSVAGLQQQQKAVLKVEGNCGMCKARIEKAAKSVSGVTSAHWNSETKVLNYTFDETKTSLEAISKAVAQAGHDTEMHKADDKVYRNLHGCCKYRK